MNYNLFGQYRDRKTIIHNLDPRVKVISVFILSTLILFMGSWGERIALTCMIVIFMAISRIRVAEALRALRP
ncbi:cobalt ABC transporter permease, partial [Candidatus Woesearchaeota archaeon]|nr:cobalt ABC transporter permease [Candidatus Woesearchaeota archaeon]